jgi:gamma-glutamyltranspeptidase / glutathione hydrolase
MTQKSRTSPRAFRQLNLVILIVALLVSPVASFIHREARASSREPARGLHGMVASQSRLASLIGIDILKRGGNAVDAAVAVGLALAVTYPEAGNLGGGGFMLIRLRRKGLATVIDYREMAPRKASRDIFLRPDNELIEGEGSSTVGYRAAGVPGTVAGLELALKKYGSGRLTWAQLVEPARRLAAEGFELPHGVARTLRNNRASFADYEESRRIFLKNGEPFEEGERLRQADLARTLGRLKRFGPREFYEGRTAQLIADDMRRHNGLITLDDLRSYVAKERAPLRTNYRGCEVISIPPSSSGGATLIQMLNILEGYDLNRMGWASAEKYHVMTEAMRRAFADRAAYLGDADFVRVPVAGLIDKAYAARQRLTISAERASSSTEVRGGRPVGYESMETTHFTVVDAEGNVVSNTYTLNDLYGSSIVAAGTGVLMSNSMDDFTVRPDTPNMYGLIQSERNAVAPRKRPLSAQTPALVLRPDGRFWFATGARGGPRIINAVLQIIINVVDHRMNIQQAIDAPRIHHQWLPDELLYEPYGLSADTLMALERMGHKLAARPSAIAGATGIMIEEGTGTRLGAVDARSDGEATGY